ncbi:hypothetical protein D7Z54_34100 [Salibacterium salarium]|uniref:Uncharacterized protein n=1 Tax=Salibacterium salarium TaxID=284579 RepID=A0A428MRW7_9BACI|nr:hypothetical protein [Salibacterium salarium]RSL28891.1 hypothetical protein D7Z54_34100 [Salibacterium salarium]
MTKSTKQTRTIELPELPKEVADALEHLKSRRSAEEILATVANPNDCWYPLNKYGKINDCSVEKLAIALFVGYTVANTPEENVREYYEGMFNSRVGPFSSGRIKTITEWNGEIRGIKRTLDILGITIPGVNAPAEETEEFGYDE